MAHYGMGRGHHRKRALDAGMKELIEMTIGRTEIQEPISVPAFRSRKTVWGWIADPIWASGHGAASTGRTHARNRSARQNSQQLLHPRAVHTCTLSSPSYPSGEGSAALGAPTRERPNDVGEDPEANRSPGDASGVSLVREGAGRLRRHGRAGTGGRQAPQRHPVKPNPCR